MRHQARVMRRGNVIRLRPGHWWFEVIDAAPGAESIVTCGGASTQHEALRLCWLALRMSQAPRTRSGVLA